MKLAVRRSAVLVGFRLQGQHAAILLAKQLRDVKTLVDKMRNKKKNHQHDLNAPIMVSASHWRTRATIEVALFGIFFCE